MDDLPFFDGDAAANPDAVVRVRPARPARPARGRGRGRGRAARPVRERGNAQGAPVPPPPPPPPPPPDPALVFLADDINSVILKVDFSVTGPTPFSILTAGIGPYPRVAT